MTLFSKIHTFTNGPIFMDNIIFMKLVTLQLCMSSLECYSINLATDIQSNMIQYGIISIIVTCVDFPYTKTLRQYSDEQSILYEQIHYEKYKKLSYVSKENDTIQSFTSILEKAAYSVSQEKSEGFRTRVNIATGIITVLTIMILKNMLLLAIVFGGSNLLWWYFITASYESTRITLMKDFRKIRKSIYDQLLFLQIRFHNNDIGFEPILIKYNILIDKYDDLATALQHSSIMQKIPNLILFMMIPTFTNETNFIAVYILFSNINSVVSQSVSYSSQHETNLNNIRALEDFFDKKIFSEKLNQSKILSQIYFEGHIDDFIQIPEKMYVNLGDKIRINGESGCGKTTLIKCLIGHKESLLYNDMILPEHHIDDICYMQQNIREHTPFTNTTIRELFDDEVFDEEIYRCLRIVFAIRWFSTTIKDLDVPILGKISGGEKTRLCLAITLYQMDRRNCQWLILDEPEQGIDPELAPEILQNIFENFQNKTIFIITHLCKCRMNEIKINKVWTIENGILSLE